MVIIYYTKYIIKIWTVVYWKLEALLDAPALPSLPLLAKEHED